GLLLPRVAIPLPHSQKPEYNERSLPQYEQAIIDAGGEPVRIPLDLAPDALARLLRDCDAVLPPGSPADIDPEKYNAARDPHTAPSDPGRDNADELCLQDAYNLRKPIFGICYGLQALNVWRTGSLVQHLAGKINHEAGRAVPRAHNITIEPASRLAAILETCGSGRLARESSNAGGPLKPSVSLSGETWVPHSSRQVLARRVGNDTANAATNGPVIPVNSSHHQAAAQVGDGLRAVARSTEDNVIEALEGT